MPHSVAGKPCASRPVAECMALLSEPPQSTAEPILCCMAQHEEDASLLSTAVSRLHEMYAASATEESAHLPATQKSFDKLQHEIYLSSDAALLADVGRLCLEAMRNHPNVAQLYDESFSLLHMLRLGNLVALLGPLDAAAAEVAASLPARLPSDAHEFLQQPMQQPALPEPPWAVPWACPEWYWRATTIAVLLLIVVLSIATTPSQLPRTSNAIFARLAPRDHAAETAPLLRRRSPL